MYKIMIVEDDLAISQLLASHLSAWGYQTLETKDFSRVKEQFQQFLPHIVLMDVSLPFYNGYYWCQEIRKISKVPIIFVSSGLDKMNIIMAMEKGGDDYITKPFDATVLVAKIQALLRRAYEFDGAGEVLTYRDLALNIKDMTVLYGENKTALTKNEFKILQILMENKRSAVSRDQLMVKLWESESFIDDNTLTVNINRLRKKLAEIGLTDFIQTKKGLGYLVD